MHEHRTDDVRAVPPDDLANPADPAEPLGPREPVRPADPAELRAWFRARLAEEVGLPVGSIDPAEPMAAYGLDSVSAITLLTEVEERLGCEIDPNALWEFPTVDSFASLLAREISPTGGSPLP
jgi:acyl carrier protein